MKSVHNKMSLSVVTRLVLLSLLELAFAAAQSVTTPPFTPMDCYDPIIVRSISIFSHQYLIVSTISTDSRIQEPSTSEQNHVEEPIYGNRGVRGYKNISWDIFSASKKQMEDGVRYNVSATFYKNGGLCHGAWTDIQIYQDLSGELSVETKGNWLNCDVAVEYDHTCNRILNKDW